MKKLMNAIKLISNSKVYDDYIFLLSISDEEEYKEHQDFLKKNPNIIKYNKALFCSLIFMFIKEQVIEDMGQKKYKSKIYDDYLEALVGLISIKKDNKYIVDSYEAPDAPTIITTIRHKFAHGDYIIDDKENNIIFYKDNKEMKINIDKLITIGLILNKYLDIIQKNKPIDRNLIEIKNISDIIKENNISNKEEVEKVFERMYIHKFYIVGINNKKINLSEAKYIQSKLDELTSCLGTPDYKPKKNQFIEEMAKRDILVTVNKNRYTAYEEHELLLKDIETNASFYKLPLECQMIYLGYLSNDTIEDKFGKLVIPNGCEVNLEILNSLEKLNDFDIFKNSSEMLQKKLLIRSIEISISSSIQRFQATFGYPLDKIYKERGDLYLVNRENSLDFSLLNLSNIEPSILTINEDPVKTITQKVDKLVNKYQALKTSIKKLETNIENIRNSNRIDKEEIIKINEEKLEGFKESFNKNMNELKENLDLRLQIEEDFKNNYQHFKNKAIIDGIRNAISHGNVEVEKFDIDGDLNDVKLHFKDIYKGKVTFEATIPYHLFETIYCDSNVEQIINFFSKQIEKNKVKQK